MSYPHVSVNRIFVVGLVCLLAQLQFGNVSGGTFTDDLGRTFTFEGKPKVAARAGIGALSLFHFGMEADQLVATWGLWGIRGSDLDPENPQAGSIYPDADPGPEAVEFLSQAVNLSPGCYTNPRGCFQWDDIELLREVADSIDYILYIDNGYDSNMITVEEDVGLPVVFIDTFFEYDPDCRFSNYTINPDSEEACLGRSMIDIAGRIEELAIALGIDVDTEKVEADKRAACQAAQDFTDTMKEVHGKGMHVKVTIFGTDQNEAGDDVVSMREFDPIQLWVPRTLEELGMPLLHSNNSISTISTSEYFVDCSPGAINETCNDNTLFPVDYWLVDSRSYLLVKDDIFPTLFPDKAILAGQHWHYPRNDGAVSYDMISRILGELSTRLQEAQPMHSPTPCTEADPQSSEILQRGGGLGQGEYICYNADLIQDEYLQCPTPGTTDNDSESSTNGGSPPTSTNPSRTIAPVASPPTATVPQPPLSSGSNRGTVSLQCLAVTASALVVVAYSFW